ncbi:MAG: DUF411 domain-containing protein [Pseudomonadota bacterium]
MNRGTTPYALVLSMTILAWPVGAQGADAASHAHDAHAHAPSGQAGAQPSGNAAAQKLPRILVHRSPSCGCCGLWVEHLRKAGFEVDVREVDNLDPVKTRVGIPAGMGSCHTAEVDGYFVEGHVPASDIKRLLAERPKAKGLTLPGMPIGSPGMEHPSGRSEPFVVRLVMEDGEIREFARHGE